MGKYGDPRVGDGGYGVDEVGKGDFVKIGPNSFAEIESVSIDYVSGSKALSMNTHVNTVGGGKVYLGQAYAYHKRNLDT